MTAHSDTELPDQLLSDPSFHAESPQREIIATLERLTDNWQQYVPRNDAEEVALGVLLNSNAAQIVSLEANRIPNARLTITGLRWKALLGNASDSERPKVVYMILKLAFESQPEPEPEVEVVEPPELIQLRQWLSLDGIKGYWHHTIASAAFWHLEVDARHKDIAFLLHHIIGGDPSEETIRDYLFQVHGLLPSATVSLASLEKLLRQDAAKNSQSEKQVDSGMPPSVKPEAPPSDNSVETDDKLPKKLRKNSPSRVKAKAAHDYAMERIPNAQAMTIAELHAAILADPEVAALVPARADAFGTFLREAGVKRYKLKS